MQTSELDYVLPEALIARRPTPARDGGRLMVLERSQCVDHWITEWPEMLAPGSLVVLNDTRVIKARLLGRRRGTGGRTELLLLGPVDPSSSGSRRLELDAPEQRWEALGRANRRLSEGSVIEFGPVSAQVVQKRADGVLVVDLVAPGGVTRAIDSCGHVPIPPYLGREDDQEDAERYQTIFATQAGSVAAPTAGLHLSERLLARLGERGIRVATLTLHVGGGTFRPVAVPDLSDHVMHAERFRIGPELVREVASARSRGAPVVAVGTTVVRALESATHPERAGEVRLCNGDTRLLIQPGFSFRVVNAILTNFHLPKSTLLALVAGFAGLGRVKEAYRAAIERGYRFYSYGDAMWIPEQLT